MVVIEITTMPATTVHSVSLKWRVIVVRLALASLHLLVIVFGLLPWRDSARRKGTMQAGDGHSDATLERRARKRVGVVPKRDTLISP